MPTYDYYRQANGQTLEVMHGMSDSVATWGEACEKAGVELGDTPADAPVTRGITAGVLMTQGATDGKDLDAPSYPMPRGGGCCGSGGRGCG